MPKKREEIIFHYRGMIESRSGWIEGYSETTDTGAIIYPWSSKRECQSNAKERGKKAVFVRDLPPVAK